MREFRSAITFLGSFLLASSSLHAGVTFTNIFSFNGTNGASPFVLVEAGNNKFYGTFQDGGPNWSPPNNNWEYGGVFSITSDGVFSNLFFFEGTNGSFGGYLTPGTDGNFYGNAGDTVFKLNPDGSMANPNLVPEFLSSERYTYGIVQDHDGTLYGMTQGGGSSGCGTIYKIDTSGGFSTLVNFNFTNGALPVALLLGADNSFYGVTQEGVTNGTIFRMDRSGNLTNVFVFGVTNGAEPYWLVQGADGDLYGITSSGGAYDAGSVFRLTTNGTMVWSFSLNGTNGGNPFWLTTANDGNFYGLTVGGVAGFGTIFRITPNGSFTSLVQFDGTNDAYTDRPGTIVQGTDGNLYGTSGGGTYGQGAIFKLTLPTCPPTNRLMLTTVVNFDDNNGLATGDFPEGGLIQASDGMLYGITQDGGAFGLGSVFRTTLSGSLTTLVSFNGTNGAYPVAPPAQAADGNFYGTTSGGGPDWGTTNAGGYGYGTIYKMDSNGDLTNLFSFNQTNGQGPMAIIQGSDGALYGITGEGGSVSNEVNTPGDGTIFKITTNGDFTLMASFDGTNGFFPNSIIQAGDGNFYGSTDEGGSTNGEGTIFRMTPDGQLTNLFIFYGTNGGAPTTVMLGSDGAIYGTTPAGGAFYSSTIFGGTVFRVTTNGDFTLLASFDGTNGESPGGRLTEVCNGVFYGTAYTGGLYPNGPGSMANNGTFFRVTTNGDLTALISFGANPLFPSLPMSGLLKASDGNYYGEAQAGTAASYNYYGFPTLYPGAIFSVRPVQAPVLQPLAQAGQINLSWNAWLGYSYAVMYETNLAGSNWTLLSNITPQTNGIASYSDNIGPDPQRFYTVVLQLP